MMNQVVTVFYPPTIPWAKLRQRPHQILKYLARLGYRCIYHDLGTTGRKKGLIEVEPGFYLLSRDSSPQSVNRDGPTILWLTLPDHFRLAGDLYQEDLVIFDLCDEPSEEFSDWAKSLADVFSVSSAVTTASALLYKKYKTSHPEVYFVPNGADYETFSTGEIHRKPWDFPTRPGPVGGYHGVLSTWLDWNLIFHVSRRLPEWNFIFVGPLFGVSQKDLPYGPNLFYLGEKDYEELPSYVNHFDVGMIPFQVREMTTYSSPIKLYEYLSLGKPVVSTKIPEVALCPYAFLASGSKEFSIYLEDARNLSMKQKSYSKDLKAWAKSNSWEARAITIDKIIKGLLRKGVG